jgi:hypothetical protein
VHSKYLIIKKSIAEKNDDMSSKLSQIPGVDRVIAIGVIIICLKFLKTKEIFIINYELKHIF